MEIHNAVGLSRPYIRQLAKKYGYQFPRNGYEVKGVRCICENDKCKRVFYRAKSRLRKHLFCSKDCYHKSIKEKKTLV